MVYSPDATYHALEGEGVRQRQGLGLRLSRHHWHIKGHRQGPCCDTPQPLCTRLICGQLGLHLVLVQCTARLCLQPEGLRLCELEGAGMRPAAGSEQPHTKLQAGQQNEV